MDMVLTSMVVIISLYIISSDPPGSSDTFIYATPITEMQKWCVHTESSNQVIFNKKKYSHIESNKINIM